MQWLRTRAAMTEQRMATEYGTAGVMPVAVVSHSLVRPMPASHSFMKTLNHKASKINEAMAATRIATQLSLMLLILPSAILSRGFREAYSGGEGCASYACMILSRVMGRSRTRLPVAL